MCARKNIAVMGEMEAGGKCTRQRQKNALTLRNIRQPIHEKYFKSSEKESRNNHPRRADDTGKPREDSGDH